MVQEKEFMHFHKLQGTGLEKQLCAGTTQYKLFLAVPGQFVQFISELMQKEGPM